MFRTVPLSIIGGLVLYTEQQVYVIQVMLTACSSILILLASGRHKLYDIYLLLCIQC